MIARVSDRANSCWSGHLVRVMNHAHLVDGAHALALRLALLVKLLSVLEAPHFFEKLAKPGMSVTVTTMPLCKG